MEKIMKSHPFIYTIFISDWIDSSRITNHLCIFNIFFHQPGFSWKSWKRFPWFTTELESTYQTMHLTTPRLPNTWWGGIWTPNFIPKTPSQEVFGRLGKKLHHNRRCSYSMWMIRSRTWRHSTVTIRQIIQAPYVRRSTPYIGDGGFTPPNPHPSWGIPIFWAN